MKVSIIIPTLNEEEYLPRLLKSINSQTFKDYEIIVADSNSSDNTIKIAKKYGAKIIKGGMPAVGRNNGAKIAQGKFIFFLDADIILPEFFLENAYNEMQRRNINLATCEFNPLSNFFIDKIMHDFANFYVKIHQYSRDPHAFGSCLLVSRKLFNEVEGFDESLILAEDHNFVKRASNFDKLRVLRTTEFYVSTRRIIKEGRLNLTWKYFKVEFYRKFVGEILDENFIIYEFTNFEKKKVLTKNKLKKFKQQIVQKLLVTFISLTSIFSL